MAFDGRVYQILIASPGDVEEERDIVVNVIQQWNALHSSTQGVVLLPLRWETHSAPEYGKRPQEVINRDVVDSCDLLVGIFWTRIGTATGVADGGTLEEIERVAAAKKPIMLYFSKIARPPDDIDLEQLGKLNGFKERIKRDSLIESYKSHTDFRDKFQRQLEIRLRSLREADRPDAPLPLELGMVFGDADLPEGPDIKRTVAVYSVTDLHVQDERIQAAVSSVVSATATLGFALTVRNIGLTSIRNPIAEIDVVATLGVIVSATAPRVDYLSDFVMFSTEFIHYGNQLSNQLALKVPLPRGISTSRETFNKTPDGWHLSQEWPALQRGLPRLVEPSLFVTAPTGGRVEFSAKIYGENLPEPVTVKASLELATEQRQVTVGDLVEVKKAATSLSQPFLGGIPTSHQ